VPCSSRTFGAAQGNLQGNRPGVSRPHLTGSAVYERLPSGDSELRSFGGRQDQGPGCLPCAVQSGNEVVLDGRISIDHRIPWNVSREGFPTGIFRSRLPSRLRAQDEDHRDSRSSEGAALLHPEGVEGPVRAVLRGREGLTWEQ